MNAHDHGGDADRHRTNALERTDDAERWRVDAEDETDTPALPDTLSTPLDVRPSE